MARLPTQVFPITVRLLLHVLPPPAPLDLLPLPDVGLPPALDYAPSASVASLASLTAPPLSPLIASALIQEAQPQDENGTAVSLPAVTTPTTTPRGLFSNPTSLLASSIVPPAHLGQKEPPPGAW